MTASGAQPVTVALDANGADAGPLEVARGAVRALREDPALSVLLVGPRATMAPVTAGVDRLDVIDAPVSIAKAEDPVSAVRGTPDASVVQAVQAVADDRAQALVSGGSTGAALAAALFRLKRLKGVHRPALAVLLPIPGRPFLLLDAGANTDARTEHLVQFAHMGAAFMTAVHGLEQPRIALLSNGAEPGKGTETVVAAHQALRELPGFVGNVEGFAVATGDADVVVADGFTGNVFLKTMEGTSKALLTAIREAATSSTRSKVGGLLLQPALGGLRASVDPEAQGGAVLLGLRRLVVVPHGSFGERGLATAVAVAARGVRSDLVGRTHGALEAAGALRRAPVMSAEPASVDGS